MAKVTVEKVRRIFFGEVYLVTVKNQEKQVEFEFKITLGSRLSSRILTKAIKELKMKLRKEEIEVRETKLYDKILIAYGKKLPPLLLTYY